MKLDVRLDRPNLNLQLADNGLGSINNGLLLLSSQTLLLPRRQSLLEQCKQLRFIGLKRDRDREILIDDI